MFNQLQTKFNSQVEAVKAIPRWRLYFWAACAALAVAYVYWSFNGPIPQPVRDYAPATTAKPVANLEKVPVAGPRRVFVFDKEKAGRKLDIPEAETGNKQEQIIEAIDVKTGPKAIGSRVVTFINTTTGQTHSVVKDIPRPWISFERGNELGAGYGMGRDGQLYAVRYRRDVLRIGSVYLTGELEGNQTTQRGAEAKATAWFNYRW